MGRLRRNTHLFIFFSLAMNASFAAQERFPQFKFPPSLSTAGEKSATIQVPGTKGCSLSLTVDRPSAFSIVATSKGAFPRLQLELFHRKQVGETQELLPGSPRRIFQVNPGNYEVKILYAGADASKDTPSCEKSDVAQNALTISVSNYEQQHLPTFGSAPGTAVHFKLDSVTETAYWIFVLSMRSELTFAVSGFPSRADEGIGVQLSTEDGHRFDPDAEVAKLGTFRYTFTLNPGTYQLEVNHESNYWPAPPLPDIDLTLHLDSIIGAPLSDELRFLTNWLKSERLDKQIEVLGLVRPTTFEAQESGLKEKYQRIFHNLSVLQQLASAKQTSKNRKSDELSPEDLAWFEAEHGGIPQGKWPTGTNEGQDPKIMLLFRPLADRDDLDKIETAYFQRWGESFWTRGFRKVSLATNIPLSGIVGYVPVYCSAQMLIQSTPGVMAREGMECAMASFGKTFEVPQLQVPQPGTQTFSKPFVFADRIDGFLRGFLPAGAVVAYLEKEKDSVEINVRNIRAHVIKGGHDWEKLDIAMFVVPKSSSQWTLRVFVDGALSSGIGGYPPDSQFTVDMEPAYSDALSNYAKELALSLGEYLSGNAK
jgi:hypothetical protein